MIVTLKTMTMIDTLRKMTTSRPSRIDPVRRAREYLRYTNFLSSLLSQPDPDGNAEISSIHLRNANAMNLGYHAMALSLTHGRYRPGEGEGNIPDEEEKGWRIGPTSRSFTAAMNVPR